uniref:mRNA cap guanine-N(7) methyltransferase n=1 Tax=Syphacia muris TaxID=451379 RepID=A0A0N5A9G1_9BILA
MSTRAEKETANKSQNEKHISSQESSATSVATKSNYTNEETTSKVADHYNLLPEKGITARLESRILYLRNFNNWIKSMLIKEFLERLKKSGCNSPKVLDLCCGKGGDLRKWRNGNISHLVATDIAEVSLQQCRRRYLEMKERFYDPRLFSAEFILADATKESIVNKLSDANIEFDLTSCQFSFHYSFETERQARQMIRNATERLKPGGYFIGTLPDADRIMYCIRKNGTGVFENEVLRLEYVNKKGLQTDDYVPPVFGASFQFRLDEQVNCPEYLVHFPVMVKLLDDCGLDLVYWKGFSDAFNYFKQDSEGQGLLRKMKALEAFPPTNNAKTQGGQDEYCAVKAEIDELAKLNRSDGCPVVGTLSKSEWEVVNMYLVFAFQKRADAN